MEICEQVTERVCVANVFLMYPQYRSWEYLKRRLKETNLVGAGGVFRTKGL